MAYDPKSWTGKMVGFLLALTCTINASCTTIGYFRIRVALVKTRRRLDSHSGLSSTLTNKLTLRSSKTGQDVAYECLSTYVYVGACIYCTLGVLMWIDFFFQAFMCVVEPLSAFLIAIVANSSGWANSYGYWRNEKLKRRERQVQKRLPCKIVFNLNEKSMDSGADISSG